VPPKSSTQGDGVSKEERRLRILALYEQGHNDCEIGRRLGIGNDTVRRVRIDHGLPTNPSHWSALHREGWQQSTGFDYVRQIADAQIAEECLKAGFPEIRSLTQLDVLRALRYGGPGTIDNIIDRVERIRGVRSKMRLTTRLSWATVNTALYRLRKIGLIGTSAVESLMPTSPPVTRRGEKGRFAKGGSGPIGAGTKPRVYRLTKDFHAERETQFRREKERAKKRRQRENRRATS